MGEVDPSTGDLYYMHVDNIGTPQAVTDSGQNVVWQAFYNPFGDTKFFQWYADHAEPSLAGTVF